MNTHRRFDQGPTGKLVDFAISLRWSDLEADVRHAAKRHLTDTVGVMIAGAPGDIATKAERALAAVRPAGDCIVPGRSRRADMLDAIFLGGTAAHGIELDDGYREGSVHPGAVVVPAVLTVAQKQRTSGIDLLEATVAGYETVNAIARAAHPELRLRGFHPTATAGVFGAAVGTARLRNLSVEQLGWSLGIAASASSGLFAFLGGGADVKRLHAGHAAREGALSALLAEQDIQGPPNIFEARDGFMQAFANGAASAARLQVPPAVPFSMNQCYMKPYACCRHLQPAIEGLVNLMNAYALTAGDIKAIDVETYGIAAKHAETGWDNFAAAQLSFPYTMALAALHGAIELHHFDEATRNDPRIADFASRLRVTATEEMNGLYPRLRPAKVIVETVSGKRYVQRADEALGSSLIPFEDEPLQAKFLGLVTPVLGEERASSLLERLWKIETAADVGDIISATVP